MKKVLLFLMALMASAAIFAQEEETPAKKKGPPKPVEWRNLDPAHYLAGRMTSSGYHRGKVVLVDVRDYTKPETGEIAKQLQGVWDTFKTKSFVILGSHRGPRDKDKVAANCKKWGVTYPVYADAGLAEDEPESPQAFVYIMGPVGKITHWGFDVRRATGKISSTLMALRAPSVSKQYQIYLDYDVHVLPGRAYNMLCEFRKKFPKDAPKYDAFWAKFDADPEVKKLGELEKYADSVKDRDYNDRSQTPDPDKLHAKIEEYSSLKQSSNPLIVQEAKNCIAELTWAEASVRK